jgi:hypothetical protein
MKKIKYSKIIVTIVIILNIIFTIAVLCIFKETHSEPTVLIGSWFSFTTGEMWMLSSIKKSEVKKEKENESDENKLETEIDK